MSRRKQGSGPFHPGGSSRLAAAGWREAVENRFFTGKRQAGVPVSLPIFHVRVAEPDRARRALFWRHRAARRTCEVGVA
jgi:hypothetical protein